MLNPSSSRKQGDVYVKPFGRYCKNEVLCLGYSPFTPKEEAGSWVFLPGYKKLCPRHVCRGRVFPTCLDVSVLLLFGVQRSFCWFLIYSWRKLIHVGCLFVGGWIVRNFLFFNVAKITLQSYGF